MPEAARKQVGALDTTLAAGPANLLAPAHSARPSNPLGTSPSLIEALPPLMKFGVSLTTVMSRRADSGEDAGVRQRHGPQFPLNFHGKVA